MLELKGNIRVFARVRPLADSEKVTTPLTAKELWRLGGGTSKRANDRVQGANEAERVLLCGLAQEVV